MKIWIAIIVLFLLAIFLWFFSPFFENEEKKSNNTITIGWIGPLSGPASSLGVDNLNAVKLALSIYETNKSKTDPHIELLVTDDQYDSNKTIIAYNNMMPTGHPVAILISTYSGLIAVAENALRDSVLIIDPVDNDKKLASINMNVILIAKETEDLAGVLATSLMDQNKKKVAIIHYQDDEFMPDLAHILMQILAKNHIEVELYPYHLGEKDFRSIIEHAKSNGSDAYIFFGYLEIKKAMEQAVELGIKPPFYASNNINQAAKGKPVGKIYIPDFTTLNGNNVNADEFMNAYQAKYKNKPKLEWTAMQAYDATNILIRAIQSVSSNSQIMTPREFSNNLREELLSVSNFEGVSGNITILPSGASRGIYFSLYALENNQILQVED